MNQKTKKAIDLCLIDAQRIQSRVVKIQFQNSKLDHPGRLDIYTLNRMINAIGDFQGDAKLLLRDGEPQDNS